MLPEVTVRLPDAEKHTRRYKADHLRDQIPELKTRAAGLHDVNRDIEKAEHRAGKTLAWAMVARERDRSRREVEPETARGRNSR